MRNRAVDVALIVGLILVAGAIVWTLFSLGRDPAPSTPAPADPPLEDSAPPDGDAGIVPVEPGASAPGGGGDDAAPASPDDDAAADADGPAGDDAGAAAAGANADDAADGGNADDADADAADGAGAGSGSARGDRPDPDVPADEAPPLPSDGPIALGRIGFSYVTGGAGACGIELEAWTHVAVSRELLEEYGCGAEVRITLDDETADRQEVRAVIADTMNPARSRTVNIYVGEDEPALEFGLTSGTLIP